MSELLVTTASLAVQSLTPSRFSHCRPGLPQQGSPGSVVFKSRLQANDREAHPGSAEPRAIHQGR
jgi:hypothetical protein